jgi:hypothetical protein
MTTQLIVYAETCTGGRTLAKRRWGGGEQILSNFANVRTALDAKRSAKATLSDHV